MKKKIVIALVIVLAGAVAWVSRDEEPREGTVAPPPAEFGGKPAVSGAAEEPSDREVTAMPPDVAPDAQDRDCWEREAAAPNEAAVPADPQAQQVSATERSIRDTEPVKVGREVAQVPIVATAKIRGVVRFSGDPPEPARSPISSDRFCPKGHDDDLLLDRGAVKDVLIWIESAPAGDAGVLPPARLAQRGCRYEPKILPVFPGQQIEIINEDPTLHNVELVGEFNIAMPKPATMLRRVKRTRPGADPVPIRCAVHPWMRAWAFVAPHPYFAVTDEKGEFEITGLPPGTHRLIAWHAKLGRLEGKIAEAAAGTPVPVEITFSLSN
jgi:hypothetical protein